MKILSETATKIITKEFEAFDLFELIDRESKWIQVDTSDLSAIGLLKCPILVEDIRKQIGFDSEVSSDSVTETMESNCMALYVPNEAGNSIYPLGTTAYGLLLCRAGYSADSSSLKKERDSNTKRVMDPQKKAVVLNYGLETAMDKSLVFILDEKVRAVHAGDEHDYSRLKMSELAKSLKSGLKALFNDVEFISASADYSFYSISYEIKDKNVNEKISKIFDASSFDTTDFNTSIRLVSSDTATSGANIFPYLMRGNNAIAIGNPILLTHKSGHNIADFENNVSQILSLFIDCETKLEEMSKKKVRNPGGMLRRIAKQCGLSKSISCEHSETFEALFGTCANYLDVFIELQGIFDEMYPSDNDNPRKYLIQENIARVCFSDMEAYDIPYQWD